MILIPIGTKAQLIKMAPLMLELTKKDISYHNVLTGQHSETMGDLINEFDLRKADYCLVRPREADSKFKLIVWLINVSKYILSKKTVIDKNNYSCCLVHGDTLSTLVGAIVAKVRKIPVVHVEAGLRSFNYLNPFPEELVRVIVSYMSDALFCPDETSFKNVKKFRNKEVIVTGNTHKDSIRIATKKMNPPNIAGASDEYYLFSFHRVENLNSADRMVKIADIVNHVAKNKKIIIVLHPTTKKVVYRYIKPDIRNNIIFSERVPFFEFINLIYNSLAVFTDGGSNQEECSYLRIPCVLLRSYTERFDGINSNVYLSNYNKIGIDLFLKRVNPMCRKNVGEDSPSSEIVSILESLYIS